MKTLTIYLVEGFDTGSHRQWARGLQRNSQHRIEIFSLEGRYWKWRMHGGAVTLAERVNAVMDAPHLFVVTDMIDLTVFRSLLKPSLRRVPVILYFHENQLTYPWSKDDRDLKKGRDQHYGFINYSSALAADQVWFNSGFHKESFLAAVDEFLRPFPDHRDFHRIDEIEAKSRVVHLGLELSHLNAEKKESNAAPLLLWNHRWEHDKNPRGFLNVMRRLDEASVDFSILFLGERTAATKDPWRDDVEALRHRIYFSGYVDSFAEYVEMLSLADLLPVTSHQDFFGISVVEAVCGGVMPVLPRRLSYPEVVGDEGPLWYDDDDGLYEILLDIILHWQDRREDIKESVPLLENRMRRYDWSRRIEEYDEMFFSFYQGQSSMEEGDV